MGKLPKITTASLLVSTVLALVLGACSFRSQGPIAAAPDSVDAPAAQDAFSVDGDPLRGSIEIQIPAGSALSESRSAAYRLDTWDGTTWSPTWLLADRPIAWEVWSNPDNDLAIGSVAVLGVGPDSVGFPELDEGWYRICSGSDFPTDSLCSTFVIWS